MLRVKCKKVFPRVWFNFEVLDHLFSKKGIFQSLGKFLHFFSKFVNVGMKPILLIKTCKTFKINLRQCFPKINELWLEINYLICQREQMALKILLIDFKIKVHDVCVKYQNWSKISIIETTCVVIDFIYNIIRCKWLIYKVKNFLLWQFILYNVIKNQKYGMTLFS